MRKREFLEKPRIGVHADVGLAFASIFVKYVHWTLFSPYLANLT